MASEKLFEQACAGSADPSARQELVNLLEGVRQGNQEAFLSLLERYRPLIEGLVSKFCGDLPGSHRDDLRQEAILVFYNSILTYDTNQGDVEFGLYAKICITHGLISQLRLHQKHAAVQPTMEISDSLFVHDSEDPTEIILEQERVEALYSVIRQQLSEMEMKVWRMYMSGRTAKEISLAVGRDEKSVTNAIYRIRKKLRASLG